MNDGIRISILVCFILPADLVHSRRSKTKCTGDRPQCRSCMKRRVTCSWQTAAADVFYALAPPPQDLEPSRNDESRQRPRSHAAAPNPFSLTKTPLVLPEHYKVQQLFEIFFARHHAVEFCSFFHKPSLDIETLHDRSPLLPTSVVSLAALYVSNDKAKSDFGFHTSCALSDHYARLAKSYAFGLYDEPSSQLVLFYCWVSDVLMNSS